MFFLCGRGYKGGGQKWKDQEMRGIGVPTVKFPKSHMLKRKFMLIFCCCYGTRDQT